MFLEGPRILYFFSDAQMDLMPVVSSHNEKKAWIWLPIVGPPSLLVGRGTQLYVWRE